MIKKLNFKEIMLFIVILQIILLSSTVAYTQGLYYDNEEVRYTTSINRVYINESDYDSNEIDRDRDTLNDMFEQDIATFFKPYFSFDSNEPVYTEFPIASDKEPLVLFQVHPVDSEDIVGDDNPSWAECIEGGNYASCRGIVITYVFLWSMDGGPQDNTHDIKSELYPCNGCDECHRGDNQEYKIWLRSEDEGGTWTVEWIKNGWASPESDCFDAYYNELDIVEVFNDNRGGYHPVIYFSAGKRHQFFYIISSDEALCYLNSLDRGCVYFHCWCCEEYLIEENRTEFLPDRIFNAGEYAYHPEPYFVNDLSSNGISGDILPVTFDGETAWEEEVKFCGGSKTIGRCDGRCAGVQADKWEREFADDADWDGIPNEQDNCTGTYNPEQEDNDGDGVGNICDNCPEGELSGRETDNGNQIDTDGDKLGDICDNCPDDWNAADSNGIQANRDGDEAGDICDGCPDNNLYWEKADEQNDPDGDGFIDDLCDTCPGLTNPEQFFPGQRDSDLDGVGDQCDNCVCYEYYCNCNPDPYSGNCYNPRGNDGNQIDTDGDGAGDGCDICSQVPDNEQRNSNQYYEVDRWVDSSSLPGIMEERGYGNNGDACDPGPVISFREAEMGNITQRRRGIFSEHFTQFMTIEGVNINYNSIRGRKNRQCPEDERQSAVVPRYCSCYDPDYGWLEENECKRDRCVEDGKVNTVWYGAGMPDQSTIYDSTENVDKILNPRTGELLAYGPIDVNFDCPYEGSSEYDGKNRGDWWNYFKSRIHSLSWNGLGETNLPTIPEEDIDPDFNHRVNFWLRPNILDEWWEEGEDKFYNECNIPDTFIEGRRNSTDPFDYQDFNNTYSIVDLRTEIAGGLEKYPRLVKWTEPYAPDLGKDYPVLNNRYVRVELDAIARDWTGHDTSLDYSSIPENSAVRGMAFTVYDRINWTLNIYGSQALYENEVPEAKNVMSAIARSSLTGQPVVYVFGGIDNNGEFRNSLFEAKKFIEYDIKIQSTGRQVENNQEEAFWWRKLDSEKKPNGRIEGNLFVTQEGELYLYGGRDNEKVYTDLWRYIQGEGWTQISNKLYGIESPPVSSSGITHVGQYAYIYGGYNENGDIIEGLYKLYLPTGRIVRLDENEGPGARYGAVLKYEENENSIYVGGGCSGTVIYEIGNLETSGSECHNDIWKYQIDTKEWTKIKGDSDNGPDKGIFAGIDIDYRTGQPVVMEGDGEGEEEFLWILNRGAWIEGSKTYTINGSDDCDGDGTADVSSYDVCNPGEGEYQKLGTIVCSENNGYECRGEVSSAKQINRTKLGQISSYLFIGNRIIAGTVNGKIKLYEIRDNINDVSVMSELSLKAGPVTDIIEGNNQIIASTINKIHLLKISDGIMVQTGQSSTIGGAILAIESRGDYLYVMTPSKIIVYNISNPENIIRVNQIGIKWRILGQPQFIKGYEPNIIDRTVAWFRSIGRGDMEIQGDKLYISIDGYLFRFGLQEPETPEYEISFDKGETIEKIKIYGNRLYTVYSGSEQGKVYNIGAGVENTESMRSHTIGTWVRGRYETDEHVYYMDGINLVKVVRQ